MRIQREGNDFLIWVAHYFTREGISPPLLEKKALGFRIDILSLRGAKGAKLLLGIDKPKEVTFWVKQPGYEILQGGKRSKKLHLFNDSIQMMEVEFQITCLESGDKKAKVLRERQQIPPGDVLFIPLNDIMPH